MNFLIFSETFFPIDRPTSKLLFNMIKSHDDDTFIVISKGRKSLIQQSNILNYQIATIDIRNKYNPYVFLQRLNRRKQGPLKYDLKNLKNAFLNYCRRKLTDTIFDVVLSLSGPFFLQHVAMEIAKERNVPFYMFYLDPFYKNIAANSFSNEEIINIEKLCLEAAKKIYMPDNYFKVYYDFYPEYKSKFIKHDLPIAFSKEEVDFIKNYSNKDNTILHNGEFLYPFRSPKPLFDLATSLPNYNFVCLCTRLPKQYTYTYPNNVIIMPRKTGLDYLAYIAKSSALIIVDNKIGIQIPSKLIEGVYLNKPIILIYDNPNSASLGFLKSYKNSFLIKNGAKIDVNSLNEFLNKDSNKDVKINEFDNFVINDIKSEYEERQ